MKKHFYSIETNEYPINLDFEEIIQTTLNHIAVKRICELSIVFIDDDYMRELNQQYRGYAQSTDVLSFESGEEDLESGHLYLGDILISYPFVHRQAAKLNNSLDAELSLMIIHGVLHLSGFDHDTPTNKEQMWKNQSEILNKLNISLTNLPE